MNNHSTDKQKTNIYPLIQDHHSVCECLLPCRRLAANSHSCFVIANLDRFLFLFVSFSICLPTRGPISLRFLFNQSYHPPTVGSFFLSWLHYVHSHTQQQTCISFVLEQIFLTTGIALMDTERHQQMHRTIPLWPSLVSTILITF